MLQSMILKWILTGWLSIKAADSVAGAAGGGHSD